ncbi:hypothetical protein M899_0561 [Bacteriovorax sp. BSW11_IV]|uniref:hypothetical protein n=1 Tax=Bacteriovorax sp. BSW11_IV TaxID=1353529 RepID=UPI000389E2B4|nr:hypothetical protein [Bacteriovorax sp. BSW11_IV]EQC45061.1 hypothetical protein M899_0561 [Bacteriovorax sp. BSW11_IV]
MDKVLKQEDKEKLILRALAKAGAATANELIDSFFKKDVRKGYHHAVLRGWRFYVHLNKHYSVLEKRGLIICKGLKLGPTGKMEKIWVLSNKSLKKHFPDKVKKNDVKLRIKMSIKKIRDNAKKSNNKK